MTPTGIQATQVQFVNSFAYTGAVIDTETGLYYMNARYYEPETGRFISEDTYRGEGEVFWNLYMYCDGDPVNNTDPTGHAKYKLVGFGMQIEASVGPVSIGFEFVWYNSNTKANTSKTYVYCYGGGGVDKSILNYAKRYLKNPKSIIKCNLSVSLCFFAIFGKKSGAVKDQFNYASDYEGWFKYSTVTLGHVKGYYATCKKCFSVGLGASTDAFGGSVGGTKYKLIATWGGNSSAAKYANNKSKNLKK